MITTYFLNLVIGNTFRTKTTPPIPASYYIGLSSTAPNIAGTGDAEPSGGAYARVVMAALSEPTSGAITNSSEIAFPESTADWGVMTHFVVYDAQTGGNLLMYDALTKSRTIQSETKAKFKANTITLTLRNPV